MGEKVLLFVVKDIINYVSFIGWIIGGYMVIDV